MGSGTQSFFVVGVGFVVFYYDGANKASSTWPLIHRTESAASVRGRKDPSEQDSSVKPTTNLARGYGHNVFVVKKRFHLLTTISPNHTCHRHQERVFN